MGAILKNDDAEALLLDIRTARAATEVRLDDRSGAFLLFPTSIVLPAPKGGQLVFPITTGVEPGQLVHHPGGTPVSATVDGVTVAGVFSWTLTGLGRPTAVAPSTYRFQQRGRPLAPPPWSDQLPRSQGLLRRGPVALARQRARLLRRGRNGEYWLLRLSEQVLRQSCRGPLHHAIGTRPHVDDDDVVQRGLQTVCRLLPLYSSPRRPPCSWLGMLHLDAKRDMHREVSRLDWLPADVAAAAALARAGGIGLDSDPSVTLATLIELAADTGRPLPRASARQVRASLEAPQLTSLEALDPGQVEPGVGQPDPGFDAVHDQPGLTAAAIAGLVSNNPRLVALAFLGDPAALRQVGDQVIGTLRRPGESQRVTRRRCRDQLRSSGRLLATEDGIERFGWSIDPDDLAALDHALRQSAWASAS